DRTARVGHNSADPARGLCQDRCGHYKQNQGHAQHAADANRKTFVRFQAEAMIHLFFSSEGCWIFLFWESPNRGCLSRQLLCIILTKVTAIIFLMFTAKM